MIPAMDAKPLWLKVAIATTIGLALVTGILFSLTSDPMIVLLGGLMLIALWLIVGATRVLMARVKV